MCTPVIQARPYQLNKWLSHQVSADFNLQNLKSTKLGRMVLLIDQNMYLEYFKEWIWLHLLIHRETTNYCCTRKQQYYQPEHICNIKQDGWNIRSFACHLFSFQEEWFVTSLNTLLFPVTLAPVWLIIISACYAFVASVSSSNRRIKEFHYRYEKKVGTRTYARFTSSYSWVLYPLLLFAVIKSVTKCAR